MTGVIVQVETDLFEVTEFMGGWDKFSYLNREDTNTLITQLLDKGQKLIGEVAIDGSYIVRVS